MSPESPVPPRSAAAPSEGAESLALPDRRIGDIERIFREHNDTLVRFIAARLGSKQEASEVAQEAYVRLLSLNHLEAVSYLRAFLFKTAANLATDRLRGRSRRSFIVQPDAGERAVFELSPERQLDGEQTLERLREAINELPVKCREAFLLYRLEELSVADIAVRLGLQERMVWRYIARALEYLRASLKDGNRTESGNQSGGEP